MLWKVGAVKIWLSVAILVKVNVFALPLERGQLTARPEEEPLEHFPTNARGSNQRNRGAEQVPATGLVRGQRGKLVPVRLRRPLFLVPDVSDFPPDMQAEVTPSRSPFWSTRRTADPLAPPATNEELGAILQKRPDLAVAIDRHAKPDPSVLGTQYQAVELKGNGLDAETLVRMTQTAKPFYVQGAKGKLWYFHPRGGNTFSYTDKFRRTDKKFIREFFRNLQASQVRVSTAVAQRPQERRQGLARLGFSRSLKAPKTCLGNPLQHSLRGIASSSSSTSSLSPSIATASSLSMLGNPLNISPRVHSSRSKRNFRCNAAHSFEIGRSKSPVLHLR